MNRPTEEIKDRFKDDMKDHSIRVIQDNGIFRHIEFSNNGSFEHRFFLTTWSDHLCISGDMGTYVFSRVEDMFRFFRNSEDELKINIGYWTEKLQSTDVQLGHREYSQEEFRECVMHDVNECWEFDSEQQKAEVIEDIEMNLLDEEFEVYAFHKAADYTSDYGHEFSDFWENNLHRPVYQYIWCLYAIVWGIQKYDKYKCYEQRLGAER